jgi:hypothetical protein
MICACRSSRKAGARRCRLRKTVRGTSPSRGPGRRSTWASMGRGGDWRAQSARTSVQTNCVRTLERNGSRCVFDASRRVDGRWKGYGRVRAHLTCPSAISARGKSAASVSTQMPAAPERRLMWKPVQHGCESAIRQALPSSKQIQESHDRHPQKFAEQGPIIPFNRAIKVVAGNYPIPIPAARRRG